MISTENAGSLTCSVERMVCGLDEVRVLSGTMRPWTKGLKLTQDSIQSLRAHI